MGASFCGLAMGYLPQLRSFKLNLYTITSYEDQHDRRRIFEAF